jgi:lysine 2,3-aminomutase
MYRLRCENTRCGTLKTFSEKSDVPWQRLLSESIVEAGALNTRFAVPVDAVEPVIRKYPMRINPYFLSLIKKPGDPIGRQVIPDPCELEENGFTQEDPFLEISQSPVPNLVHRHPDRVLFLVSGQCAVYCRHCMRKRNAGVRQAVDGKGIDRAVKYIRSRPDIREVILSGGDPLLQQDAFLADIMDQLSKIPHVGRLRIHTRVPGVLPQRITSGLVELLRRFSPLYINIQFNHPDELSAEAAGACAALSDAGIVLGSQTVLLKEVNDDVDVMAELMERLLSCRVRPYYLHHPDPVRGTAHFNVPVERGLEIMKALKGKVSGMGIPQYVMELPGGRGKVPVGS